MNLWVAETSYCHTLITLAETEEEARKKVEGCLSKSDSVVTIRKQEEEVIYV